MKPSRQIICYDSDGNRRLKRIAEPLYQQILKMFNGKLHAVKRSSGGMGLALPVGLKFKNETAEEVTDPREVAVIMKCIQFDSSARTADSSSHSLCKVIPFSQIQEGFEISIDGEQRCVVDLGMGIIPIQVVGYFKSGSGQEMASFLDYTSHAKLAARVELSPVQLYCIPKECLRQARAEAELESARQNWERLIICEKAVIPEVLKMNEPFVLQGCSSFQSLRDQLSEMQDKTILWKSPSPIEVSTEGLLPFGLFEFTISVVGE